MIAPAVRDFLDLPKTEFHLVGTDYSRTIGRKCRFTPWVPADASLAYYRAIDFDIGLAPLTGTRFDASKSAIKVLEYAALGIPSIASDVTPYRGFVVDGVTGWLARTPEDWSRRLREMAQDRAMREEMGAKAKEMAAAHAIGACWRQWADVYEELL
jgi:glycosyltransferase involved in cell wall biosynthesis